MAEMVRAGTLKEDDPVRREAASEWTPARKVIGLFRAAAKEAAQATPEAKAAPKRAQAPGKPKRAEPPPRETRPIGRRRVLLAGGLVVALVLLVAGVSAWRASRRERFPEPFRARVPVLQEDLLAPVVAERSGTASTPVPNDPVPQPAGDDVAELKAQFTLDFREDFQTQAIKPFAKTRGGADTTTTPSPVDPFSVEPAGVRMTIPNGGPVGYCGCHLRIRLQGDFRITARHTILDLEPATSTGAGIGILVQDAQGTLAALHRTIRKRHEHFFDGTLGERREEGGYDYRKHVHDTSSEALSGWMRLERVGSSIRFQIASPHSERFIQIHEAEFPPGEVVKVMFKAQTRGSPTAVDVVWSSLDVQAEEIVREY
jgi:hypothetical protein